MMSDSADHPSQHNKQPSKAGFIRYRILLLVLWPALLLYTAFQAIRFGQWSYLLQRLGIYFNIAGPTEFWIHAASVGEVNAAAPLIHAIRKKHPNITVLLTTTTPTGAETAKRFIAKLDNPQSVVNCYLPLDYRLSVKRLLRRTSPRCLLVMETEIWPNLFRCCHEQNVLLITINGRLSQRTLHTAAWIKSLYRSTLHYSSLILTRSDHDSKNYIALGAAPQKVKTIGNIKFSARFNVPDKGNHPFNHRRYVLAASTHDNEEQLITQLWKQHSGRFSDCLLVIAPRHPKRIETILQQLKPAQLNIAVRSRNDSIDENTQIYIVDTLGELIQFMVHADIVFMGGSLVPTGGHNILEPAVLSKAIVFGPYMHNFADEASQFLNHDSAVQVDSVSELGDVIGSLLEDERRRRELGANARAFIESQQDAADRYVAEIDKLLKNSEQSTDG
ncbi:MAG: 3-deoxy-D-manno-octulosonic acid transferase [Gammaproteobacteria bacterium]|jgi:3-deoxy-D-manno-octulosonic-acid transferase